MTSASDINAGKAVIGVVLDDSTIKQQMDSTAARMQASAAGIHASTISTLKEQLKAGTITQDEYTAAVNRSKKSLDGAGLSAKETTSAFGGMKSQIASMVAAYASIATVVSAVRSVAKEFQAIEEDALLAEKLGIANDRFQGMKIAAQQADVELTAFTSAIQKMSVQIGKASLSGEESTKWLNRMGLTLADLIDLSADQQFLKIASAMRESLSATEQMAAAAEIFGRGSTDMVRLLTLTKEGLDATTESARATGQAVGDLAVKQIKAANDAMDRLANSWEGLKRSLATSAGPFVAFAIDDITKWCKEVRDTFIDIRHDIDSWYGLLPTELPTSAEANVEYDSGPIEKWRQEYGTPTDRKAREEAKAAAALQLENQAIEDRITLNRERAETLRSEADEYEEMMAAEREIAAERQEAERKRIEAEKAMAEQTAGYAAQFEAHINAPLIAEEERRKAAKMEAAKTRMSVAGTFSGWRLSDQFSGQTVDKEMLAELKKINEGLRKYDRTGDKTADYYT